MNLPRSPASYDLGQPEARASLVSCAGRWSGFGLVRLRGCRLGLLDRRRAYVARAGEGDAADVADIGGWPEGRAECFVAHDTVNSHLLE